MTRAVHSRTLIAIVALIIVAFLAAMFFCLTFVNRYYVSIKEREMLRVFDSISSLYSDIDNDFFWETSKEKNKRNSRDELGEKTEFQKQEDELSALCDELNISTLVQRADGNSIFGFGNEELLSVRLEELIISNESTYTPVIIDKNDKYTVQTVSKNGTNDIEYIEMWGILPSQNSFVLRTSFSSIQNSVRVALLFFLFISAVIVVIAAIIIYLLAYSYSKPIRELVAATQGEDIAGSSSFNSRRTDELGILGANISEMSSRLEKAMSELKSSNLKLKNELKAKAELDEQRKKYISDISHELKTPIALISGYAEGLREGIGGTKEDQDYYLDVIIDEAEKMNLMVKRISSLNKLEQGQSDVEMQRFDVVEVINGYLNTMALIFDEKKIEIFFNDKNVIYVWSDEFLFEEVLMNYLNNALNHVDERLSISITVQPIDSCARVTVFNTGKQIPEEEIDKVWGEFYKVDKARTREYGGSGLGLSIVKAIADTLGQKCGVYNTDTGVAFWIDLELDKVQEYSAGEMEKRTSVKMSDLPIWKTTTKVLKDTSSRLENSARERAEKEARRKEEKAARDSRKKAERAEKEAQKKEEKAAREQKRKDRQTTVIKRNKKESDVEKENSDATD